jgi:hypothetical protein
MAQQESPREDLLREATALIERLELVPRAGSSSRPESHNSDSPIVAGFRAGGGLSIFFGEDPAYHFNAAGELRRAYVDSLLYKAINGELVSLSRIRSAEQVELRSHKLSAPEQAAFIQRISKRLSDLVTDIAANSIVAREQVPPDNDVLDRLRTWLANHLDLQIASRPNA